MPATRMTTLQQLTAIEEEADRLVASQEEVWRGLREALAAEAVILVGQEPLDEKSEAWLDQYFREQIFPLLTPQAIDPAHPFPFIPNRGFSLIFELKRGKVHIRELIMLPAGVPRFVRIPGHKSRYITLESLIRRKTDYLFPKYELIHGGAVQEAAE